MDTDGDGSIGDPVGGSATNREGIFDLAQNLYDTGWDVLAFDSTNYNVNDDNNVAEVEIKHAWDYRFVSPLDGGTGVAVMGYSWGGGVTHDLLEELYDDGYPAIYGVFLDAVVHGSTAAEDDWPAQVFYLLDIWQPNGVLELGGGPIWNPEEMSPFSDLEEVDVVNDWGLNLDHYSIDDNLQVQQLITTRLGQLLVR